MLTDKQVREKLVNQGARSLSDAELLSLLLQKGGAECSALEMAQRVLEAFDGNLPQIAGCEPGRLRSVENIGIARAAVVTAALELGRRSRGAESWRKETIRSDRDIIEIFQPQLATLPHEEFWAVFLNAANKVLDKVRISQGGVTGTVADHKLIIKRAVERLAQGIVLVHNHPSGNPQPSEQDERITENTIRAASLFDIVVADHVIVTSGECYSFRNHGFFDKADKKL